MVTVKDILQKKGAQVDTIGPKDTVLDAAKLMNAKRIGALVVTEGSKAIGIFSERDMLTRVVASQLDPATTTVGQVMTSPVACCPATTKIEECKSVMTMKRIRHLPVVDDTGLIGMITSGDLLAMEAVEQEKTIEFLNQYIYGPNY